MRRTQGAHNKQLVDKGEVRLVHQGTDTMVADVLAKLLGPDKFRRHATRMLQDQAYPRGGARTDDESDGQEL
jgi:hypothetical protein